MKDRIKDFVQYISGMNNVRKILSLLFIAMALYWMANMRSFQPNSCSPESHKFIAWCVSASYFIVTRALLVAITAVILIVIVKIEFELHRGEHEYEPTVRERVPSFGDFKTLLVPEADRKHLNTRRALKFKYRLFNIAYDLFDSGTLAVFALVFGGISWIVADIRIQKWFCVDGLKPVASSFLLAALVFSALFFPTTYFQERVQSYARSKKGKVKGALKELQISMLTRVYRGTNSLVCVFSAEADHAMCALALKNGFTRFTVSYGEINLYYDDDANSAFRYEIRFDWVKRTIYNIVSNLDNRLLKCIAVQLPSKCFVSDLDATMVTALEEIFQIGIDNRMPVRKAEKEKEVQEPEVDLFADGVQKLNDFLKQNQSLGELMKQRVEIDSELSHEFIIEDGRTQVSIFVLLTSLTKSLDYDNRRLIFEDEFKISKDDCDV